MLTSKNFFVAILFFSVATLFAQQHKVDSLNVLLKKYNKNNKDKTLSLSDSVKVKILNQLFYHHVNYEQSKALAYTQEALLISQKINYKSGIANSYGNLARIYNATAEFDLALEVLHKSNIIFKELKDVMNLAHNYSEMGVVFSKRGNAPDALSHYIQALKFYEQAGDELSVGFMYTNIGITHKQQKEYGKALDYYFKAIKIFKKVNNLDARFGIASTYSNIGNVYLMQGLYQKSLETLYEGMKLAEEFENPYLSAESYQSIGENNLKLGNYDVALDSYSKAIKFCQEIDDKAGIANSHINIGYSYFKKGDTTKAISNINSGLSVAQKVGLLDFQKNAHRYLSEIHATASNYKLAYENQVLFKKINDSLFNTERNKKITEMQMQYDFDKVQQVQKAKVAKLNQETEKQKIITYIVIFALICMSGLAFGIFFNLRKNQKQKAIIAAQKETVENQNLVIQESLTEKETLLREIHHRVKNNLQIISSLLNIQSQHISDENVLSSIQEGQSRVQAMSLIHQNLYQSEHLSNVDIENYLRELVVYLSDMFAGNDKSIKVEVEASNIKFDIDTAIPLGLIVNELVSNAYKYAFQEKSSGKINIKIKALNDVDYELDVHDDGIGLPSDFDPKKSKSLGLKLVNILSRQLRGNMRSSSDQGTSFIIQFKDIKAYQSTI